MKYILILILIGAVMLTACTKTVEEPLPVDIGGGIGDGKTYVSESPEECMVIKFMCEQGKEPFFDENGCGCQLQTDEGKLQAIDCTDPRPEACTREYMPVCGQVQVQCITEPCDIQKETFANKCTACSNPLTISYTEGACEDNAAGGTVLAGTQEEQCTSMGGTWTGYDCTGIDANQCQEIGGTFNECASACRNDPTAEICTLQCVVVCEFN